MAVLRFFGPILATSGVFSVSVAWSMKVGRRNVREELREDIASVKEELQKAKSEFACQVGVCPSMNLGLQDLGFCRLSSGEYPGLASAQVLKRKRHIPILYRVCN